MKLLHVDDNDLDQKLCEELIKRTRNWTYYKAGSISEGLAQFDLIRPNVVLIDIGFPNQLEDEVYAAMTTMSRTTTVIALSGRNDQDSVDRAHRAGAAGFINKNAFESPQAFHDKILEAVKRGLMGAKAEDHRWQIVEQLAEVVVWGNGKPGLVIQVAQIDEKISAGQIRFESIEKKLDKSRLEGLAYFAVVIVGLVLTFIQNESAILHNAKIPPPLKAVPFESSTENKPEEK